MEGESIDHTLAIAAIALAGPPILQIGVDLFKKARHLLYRRHAMDDSAKERYKLAFDVCEARLKTSKVFLQEKNTILQPRHAVLLTGIIHELESLLSKSKHDLNTASASLAFEEHLEKIWGRLRQWQHEFDGFAIALSMSESKSVHLTSIGEQDQAQSFSALRRVQALRDIFEERLNKFPLPMPASSGSSVDSVQQIAYSQIWMAKDYLMTGTLIEHRAVIEEMRDDVLGRLAFVLRSVNPHEMCLLRCQGYAGNDLLFSVPREHGTPCSLRGLLLRQKDVARHPLQQSFELLRQLATAPVSYTHLTLPTKRIV